MTRRGKHWMVRLLCTRQNASTIDAPTYAELVEGLKDQTPTAMHTAWDCATATDAARMAFGTVNTSVVCKPVTLQVLRSDRQRLKALDDPQGWIGFERLGPLSRVWREIPLGAPPASPAVVPTPQVLPRAPRTPQAYRETHGQVCPVCEGWETMTYGPLQMDDTEEEVVQGVRGTRCHATWTGVYTLQGYRALDLASVAPRWRT